MRWVKAIVIARLISVFALSCEWICTTQHEVDEKSEKRYEMRERTHHMVDLSLIASHRLVARKLKPKVSSTDRVMDQLVGGQGAGRRVASNDDQGKVLCVRAGNSVEAAERSHPIRDTDDANSLTPRISISSVSSVELVAALDEGDAWFKHQLVQEDEGEIPWNVEDVTDTNIGQP